MKRIALLLLFLPLVTQARDIGGGIRVYEDRVQGVTCYFAPGGSLSCVKTSEGQKGGTVEFVVPPHCTKPKVARCENYGDTTRCHCEAPK